MMNYIDKIRKNIEHPKITAVLNEDMMWQSHGSLIWKADKFIGKPCYYPVYQFENYYSYSPLALILKKQNLNVNSKALKNAELKNFIVQDIENFIDRDIKRLGGPHNFTKNICNVDDYCQKIVAALKQDIALIEDKNEGFTNVIMCGGKDSLNLLLLPWKNPIIAISAAPNFSLVCDFINENGLNIEVVRLEDDYTEEYLLEEIAELCCRLFPYSFIDVGDNDLPYCVGNKTR